LSQENGFSPARLALALFAETGKKRSSKACAPAKEESNKYDLTAVPYFGLDNHNDWSRWFAISSSHLFALLVSGWGSKIVNN
jgi:hypothetical protein